MSILNDIAEKLKLRKIVDQSSTIIPTSRGTDVSEIYEVFLDQENIEQLSIIPPHVLTDLAIMRGLQIAENKRDLEGFTHGVYFTFLKLAVSVNGNRSIQFTDIAKGGITLQTEIEKNKMRNEMEGVI